MAPGIRLYVLDLGGIVLGPRSEIASSVVGQGHRIPVAAYLIAHPAGNLLYDTGMDPLTSAEPVAAWGGLLDEFTPQMKPEDHIVARLAAVGVRPEDIRYVVLSHLHCDHAGGVCLFPEAEVIVQRAELEATVPDAEAVHRPELYGIPRLKASLVECVRCVRVIEDDVDLFGDGRVQIIATPGHSPGHQSLLVRLDRTGDVLIAGDAGCDEDQVDNAVVTDGDWSPTLALRSMSRLRDLRECCALVIYGHDADAWPALKHSPEYYD